MISFLGTLKYETYLNTYTNYATYVQEYSNNNNLVVLDYVLNWIKSLIVLGEDNKSGDLKHV